MPPKAELERELQEMEAEYRYWVVEAINIERAIERMEAKIDRHERELGPERTAEFRLRLAHTRDRLCQIEERTRLTRLHLDDLRAWLAELP
ncbi:MAG: hypothetical protein ACRERD_32640 [Candidatus Binatia bacterium]